MDIIKNTDIKFVKNRKKFYKISAAIIIIGIISLLFQGLNYGIDFAGGTLLQLDFETDASIAEIRNVLEETTIASSTIQSFSGNEFVIRTDDITLQQREEILEKLNAEIGPFEVLRIEMVGPVIGESLKGLAVLAIIFAFIGIILYITVRFEFRYAISSIIALGHDILIALAILSLLQKEITIPIIAAILTIVGYSLNNTIVIFDRLRENLRTKTRPVLEKTIDLSINQSLTRTINTAITTLLPVLALYFFGGTLSDFAFVLLIGIVVGTYSSICMAGPLLLELKKRSNISFNTTVQPEKTDNKITGDNVKKSIKGKRKKKK